MEESFRRSSRIVRVGISSDQGTNKVAGMIIEMPKGEEEIRLNSEAFVLMKRLRVLINRNASFSSGPNYLSNELRVLDWFKYPLQSLPPNFHGNKLIIFKMCGSVFRELSFIKFKNMAIMDFSHSNFLTKVPDLSSLPNLKELIVEWCTSLVEVHNSVGSLEYLRELNFFGCYNLENFPISLKLRCLRRLDLSECSSLRSCPEFGCEMKSLTDLNLSFTAVEELPLSICNLSELDDLNLLSCKNLKHLPINFIPQLQHLTNLGMFGISTNLVKKMGSDGRSILPIGSTTVEDEISSNEEQLQELVPPMNSSNGSSALQVLNLQNCFHSKSNFFPISSFFTIFNSSATLTYLNLSSCEFVSLPTTIKGFVALHDLHLSCCKKLEEILELPPNIAMIAVNGCKSLERFSEVSRKLEFNESHIRSLRKIYLTGCDKMQEKIWTYKVPNLLLWKENQISEWGGEGVLNIKEPHHLDIRGIVVYVSFKDRKDERFSTGNYGLTINISNPVCRIDNIKSQWFLNGDISNKFGRAYETGVWYFDLESFEIKVSDYLRVQIHILDCCYPSRLPYYISWGADVVYKHESRGRKRRKMD